MATSKATLHTHLPLIEVADKHILDMLLMDAVAAQCILTRLSDQCAVVAPRKRDALLARLSKLGHTPKVLGH